jgi:transposase InsO family protein
VIHHSDCGVQYPCREYRRELQSHGLVASMNRRGNCYDNAVMQAFWSTLKREALADSAEWTQNRVRRELFEYIEADYNRSRLHSSLGYESPVGLERTNN